MTTLDGFDRADSSTWHPRIGRVMDALRGAPGLGIPLGGDLATPAEHIARILFPPGSESAEVEQLRRELRDTQLVALANARERDELLERLDGEPW